MSKAKYFILFLLFLAIAAFFLLKKKQVIVASFEDCVKAGFPVLESYPPQCKTSDGKSFSQKIGNELEYVDLIVVDSPRLNTLLTSPVEVKGKARGTWFFEASFGVEIKDANGLELGNAVAQAEGEWMTEEFVPFKAILNFTKPTTSTGELIIRNANPSGLAENEKELRIPVAFDMQ